MEGIFLFSLDFTFLRYYDRVIFQKKEAFPVLWIILPLIAGLGGVVHTVTGFGSGIVMMLFLPYFWGMASAPALSGSINLFLSLVLAIQFRKTIRVRLFLLPIIPYLLGSTLSIYALSGFDMRMVAIAFGAFLILLSVYFIFIAKHMTVNPTWQAAVVCGGLSGITAGLFGIGGPLMALYFLAITDSKESYTGNLQGMFTCTCLCNTLTRISRGYYTLDLLPLTFLGLISIYIGKVIGLRLLDKMDPNLVRKIVYLFVGVSGVMTVVQNLV